MASLWLAWFLLILLGSQIVFATILLFFLKFLGFPWDWLCIGYIILCLALSLCIFWWKKDE